MVVILIMHKHGLRDQVQDFKDKFIKDIFN